MKVVSRIDQTFHDIASLPEPARETGSNGVVYPSVRHARGSCIGAFRPKAVHPPVQERHIRYHWDDQRVSRWFDYTTAT